MIHSTPLRTGLQIFPFFGVNLRLSAVNEVEKTKPIFDSMNRHKVLYIRRLRQLNAL